MSLRKLIKRSAKGLGSAILLVAVVGIYLGPDTDRRAVLAEFAAQFTHGLVYGTTDPDLREKAKLVPEEPVKRRVGSFLTTGGGDIGQFVQPAAESLDELQVRAIEIEQEERRLKLEERRRSAHDTLRSRAERR